MLNQHTREDVEDIKLVLDTLQSVRDNFDAMDAAWEEANKDHPDEAVATGTQYAKYTELLGDIHSRLVDELTELASHLQAT